MPALGPHSGRKLVLKRGETPTVIAGVRTKSFTINGEPIDVTSDDDSAVRKLLAEPGERAVEISVSGVLKDDALLVEALKTDDRVDNTVFEWPEITPTTGTAGSLSGDFFLASYTQTGEYQGMIAFDATFQSAGDVTYTAPT